MSRWTHCGGVEKILLANLAIILVCAAWLMLAGCGNKARVSIDTLSPRVDRIESRIGEMKTEITGWAANTNTAIDMGQDSVTSWIYAIISGSVVMVGMLVFAYPAGRLLWRKWAPKLVAKIGAPKE